MQNSVPPARTVRVVTRGVESEGHVARVCGLFVKLTDAFAAPKLEAQAPQWMRQDKRMKVNDLVWSR